MYKLKLNKQKKQKIDERGSFFKTKKINVGYGMQSTMHSDNVPAYVFGERKDKVFLQLKILLASLGIKHFYADDWGTYERNY